MPVMLAVPYCPVASTCLPYVACRPESLAACCVDSTFTRHTVAASICHKLLVSHWVKHAVAGWKHGQSAHWLSWYDKLHTLLHTYTITDVTSMHKTNLCALFLTALHSVDHDLYHFPSAGKVCMTYINRSHGDLQWCRLSSLPCAQAGHDDKRGPGHGKETIGCRPLSRPIQVCAIPRNRASFSLHI